MYTIAYFCFDYILYTLHITDALRASCVLSQTFPRSVVAGDLFVSLLKWQSVLFARMELFIPQGLPSPTRLNQWKDQLRLFQKLSSDRTCRGVKSYIYMESLRCTVWQSSQRKDAGTNAFTPRNSFIEFFRTMREEI